MEPADRTTISFTESLGRGVARETINEVQTRVRQFIEAITAWRGDSPDIATLKDVRRIMRRVERELSRLPVGMVAAHRCVEHRKHSRIDLLVWSRGDVERGESRALEPTLVLQFVSLSLVMGPLHSENLIHLSHHAIARFCQFNRLLDHHALLPQLAELSRAADLALVAPTNACFGIPCGAGAFACETKDDAKIFARTWLRDRDRIGHGKLIGRWRETFAPKLSDAKQALDNLSKVFDATEQKGLFPTEAEERAI